MEVKVQPARRQGSIKRLFFDALEPENLLVKHGCLTVSFIADDQYTRNAKQHVEVIFSPEDLDLIRLILNLRDVSG